MSEHQQVICESCGVRSLSVTKKKGTMLITIVLLCFMFVPGIIYWIWRIKSKHEVCANCGSTQVVPINSPRGEQLLKQMNS